MCLLVRVRRAAYLDLGVFVLAVVAASPGVTHSLLGTPLSREQARQQASRARQRARARAGAHGCSTKTEQARGRQPRRRAAYSFAFASPAVSTLSRVLSTMRYTLSPTSLGYRGAHAHTHATLQRVGRERPSSRALAVGRSGASCSRRRALLAAAAALRTTPLSH